MFRRAVPGCPSRSGGAGGSLAAHLGRGGSCAHLCATTQRLKVTENIFNIYIYIYIICMYIYISISMYIYVYVLYIDT